MSGNQFEGGARELGGKVKDAVGGLAGDAKTQGEGKLDQVVGKAQQQYGAAADAAGDLAETVGGQVREYPIASLLIAAGIGWLIGRAL